MNFFFNCFCFLFSFYCIYLLLLVRVSNLREPKFDYVMTKTSLVLYKSTESIIGTIFWEMNIQTWSVPSVLNIQTFPIGHSNVG